jgi:hypothetical protein
MSTTDQKWTVALLKVLDDMDAPDYAFGDILSWGRSANVGNYSYYPVGGLSRSKNIDMLFASVPNAGQLLPSEFPVVWPNGMTSNVIAFDFVPQVLRLLQNPKIMLPDNLVIDLDHPLLPFQSPGNVLGEALSGSVYCDAYARYITDPTKQLFVPIIQWIDRTSVTGNDRFSLKPYMFTPAIFTENFRRSIKAWGYHGYLPKPKNLSVQNQTLLRQGDNICIYHAQRRVVFLSTFETANAQLRNITLPIGPNRSVCVDVVTCILFVIQDMQEGDTLCGRYGPHTPLIQRHCRACNVSYDNLDNQNVKCMYLDADMLNTISASDDPNERKRWSQHCHDSVYQYVPMADPIRGICGSTPVETMHCFCKGMIEIVTFLVLENVPASKKAALDGLAIHFHKTHHISQSLSSYRLQQRDYQLDKDICIRTPWPCVLVCYPVGWNIIDTALQVRTNTTLAAVLQLFEAMLCFDAWLNKPTYWHLADTADAAKAWLMVSSLRTMMRWCKTRIPTTKSARWNFPKFHELLHIIDDMIRFGASTNVCAQQPESLLALRRLLAKTSLPFQLCCGWPMPTPLNIVCTLLVE